MSHTETAFSVFPEATFEIEQMSWLVRADGRALPLDLDDIAWLPVDIVWRGVARVRG